ncbi:hypothetical protein EOD39_11407 [Acipenser ruthenus]|uniref:Uncharacterized protein n=1 Tax=Acipenser ruthenus TaxID=7906 RepID=A0A444UP17_ACIRT|nr:hypothetical protein EOD39_11407 [Acipenser ruthenus]
MHSWSVKPPPPRDPGRSRGVQVEGATLSAVAEGEPGQSCVGAGEGEPTLQAALRLAQEWEEVTADEESTRTLLTVCQAQLGEGNPDSDVPTPRWLPDVVALVQCSSSQVRLCWNCGQPGSALQQPPHLGSRALPAVRNRLWVCIDGGLYRHRNQEGPSSTAGEVEASSPQK